MSNNSQYKIQPHRLAVLDGLRGIAIIAVIFYHWTTRYRQLFTNKKSFFIDFAYGQYGVHLFFMISGFVILMSLEKSQSAKDFFIFRVFRLFPTYWLSCFLTFIIIKSFGLPKREVGLFDAIMNIPMITNTLGYKYIDVAYWSLEVEIFFYVLIGSFFTLGIKKYIFPAFSCLILLHALTPYLHPYYDAIMISKIFTSILAIKYLHLFLFGMVCYRANIKAAWWHKPLLLFCILSTLPWCSQKYFLTISFIAMLFWLAITYKFKFLESRVLLFFGFISYPLYLLHQNISYLIMQKSFSTGYSPLLVFPCLASILIVATYLITKNIEKPSNIYLRKIYKAKEQDEFCPK